MRTTEGLAIERIFPQDTPSRHPLVRCLLPTVEQSFSVLNMRSTTPETPDRIRDAAIVEFADRGFDGASLRDIAARAGVSAALIVHHFGSKAGLRDACDAHVVQTLVTDKSRLGGAGAAGMMRAALADRAAYTPLLDYLARMLASPGPAADALFDALTGATRELLEQQRAAGMMREQSDMEVTVAMVTLYGLAPVLLRRQLARSLGESDLTETLLRRMTLPLLELYTHGIYADDRLLTAAREALDRPAGPPSGKGENDPVQDPDPPSAP